ncbi:MAG: exodeoxyribonuclease V subunit gamma [Synechococcaceae cyanobacterium]|nr:exodeoxyribonuclease V subunit gamma [Synechococcaceae cyanobacterium]
MLNVFRSNRAENLAAILATQLRLSPPEPFETVAVIVNTWPTSRWLGEQLALELGGIAANLLFPFPGAQLRRILSRLETQLELQPPGAQAGAQAAAASRAAERGVDDWRATRLVWSVLALLDPIAALPEGEPLRRWLGPRQADQPLDAATWQLARAIADAFDDYALYRPDVLLAWEAGRDVNGRGEPLAAGQRWQPALYRALRGQLDGLPFGLRVERLIAALQQSRSDGLLPALGSAPLRLFGLSSLAPVQVRLLQALSAWITVDLYLLTPCRDLWTRCQDRRRTLSDALALHDPFDADWLLQAPPLEARFGRMGGEFQQLLEGSGDAEPHPECGRDLFFLPANACGSGAPLLAQLQQQLVDPGEAAPLQVAPADSSLEFHACPGDWRQVQVMRDRLLQLMAADPSLEPRHILVMTPQVERFAPLIAAVFGDAEATGVQLPWRLTDRSQQDQAGIGSTLLRLLQLGGERLTASGLEELLACPPLQERFGLSREEIHRLHGVLQRCGFRWGLDGESRGGDATHSLAWACDRLLLGLVLPDAAGLSAGQPPVAPAGGELPLELLGRWLHLLERLRHWLARLNQARLVPDWCDLLRQLLADLFVAGGAAAAELPPLLEALADWEEDGATSGLTPQAAPRLESPVVAAVLQERLAVDSGRFGHRSGALTISALEPMRAIPHRVVVLMGLDAGAYPRQQQRPGFHLLDAERRLGDPRLADQDRYALLEALLSARQHLLISWSCRDDRTGESLEPSGPVRQWLGWLADALPEHCVLPLLRHAASPLDRRNFLDQPRPSRPPASCDRRLLQARRQLDGAQPPRLAPLQRRPMPAPGSLPPPAPGDGFEDLRGWLMEPQKQWLRSLGMRAGEWDERLEDLESLGLEERQRALLLRRRQQEVGAAAAAPRGAGPEMWWLQQDQGRGLLPARAAGELEARLLEQRWSSLQASLTALGDPWSESLGWELWQSAPQWRGHSVVVVQPGRPTVARRMDLWLQLLLAAAAAPQSGRRPQQGVLIARADQQRLTAALSLNAPEPQAARAELERLAGLRQQWRDSCWPVPPRSGWSWLEAECRRAGSGAARARAAWEGDGGGPGERLQEEMVVCFGADLPASELIGDGFGEAARSLYAPLMESCT